jgi:FkbM family methyltransferase
MEVVALNLTLGQTQRDFLFRKGTSDEGVIVQVLQNSDYNFGRLKRAQELADFFKRLTQSGKTPLIVDAGANIGASAVYFAYSFAGARIVAIEPERGNFDLLAANTADLPVECLHAALAASVGRLNVVDPGEGHWGYRTTSETAGAELDSVETVTMNDIYRRYADSALPFIAKIDIEGAESELFAANTEWVDRTPVIIIELHDWMMPGQANSSAFLKCIAGRNRDFVYFGENVFSIDNSLVPAQAAA